MDNIDPRLVAEILATVRGRPLLQRFDCGCEMGMVGVAFVMRPCRPDCEKYLYTMAKAAELDRPMRIAWDGDLN